MNQKTQPVRNRVDRRKIVANGRPIQVVANGRGELEVHDRRGHLIETQDECDGEKIARLENKPGSLGKRVLVVLAIVVFLLLSVLSSTLSIAHLGCYAFFFAYNFS